MNLSTFNRFQLIKLLDIYKYNDKFMREPASARLKGLLEARLEERGEERLNESEEEELKQMKKVEEQSQSNSL